jgi:hypothetical protein
MKKVMGYLCVGLLLTSCVASYKISNEGKYSQFKCVKAKQDMYLLQTYDTCPIFSVTPVAESSIWKLYAITDSNRQYLKDSNRYEGKVLKNSRDCGLPSRVTISRIVNSGQKINLQEIITRSDANSTHNLFLIGDLILNDKSYLIRMNVDEGYGKK